MTKKDYLGIAYVSVWVIVWGSFGSLVDFPLLKAGIYIPGSIGQISTFLLTAILSLAIGIWLYPKVIGNRFQ